jgi:hypothetical protein
MSDYFNDTCPSLDFLLDDAKDFSAFARRVYFDYKHDFGAIRGILDRQRTWFNTMKFFNAGNFVVKSDRQEKKVVIEGKVFYQNQGTPVPKNCLARDFINWYATPNSKDSKDMATYENKYWIEYPNCKPPLYGHCCKSITNGEILDLGKLNTILDEMKPKKQGIHFPFLYFGQRMTSFTWHTEDSDLFSINLLLSGDPKIWFIIHPADTDKFEALVKGKLMRID